MRKYYFGFIYSTGGLSLPMLNKGHTLKRPVNVDDRNSTKITPARCSEPAFLRMQIRVQPVSIGKLGSFDHSDIEASYSRTSGCPSIVSTSASELAAIPPPQ